MPQSQHGGSSDETRASKLAYEVTRLTRELEAALEEVRRADADRLAAEALLEESTSQDGIKLASEITAQQHELEQLQADVAEEERRKLTAEGVTKQVQATTELARRALQDVTEATKSEERRLRTVREATRKAEDELTKMQDMLEQMNVEVALLRADVASYTQEERVSCGCMFHLKKGPECKPGAMITIISSCKTTDDEPLTRHVVERNR